MSILVPGPLEEPIPIVREHDLSLEVSSSISDDPLMMSFLGNLEGYKTFIKEAHWAAPSDPVHLRLDEFLDTLSDFQDAVAEGAQAIMGQMRPHTFSANPFQSGTIFDLIKSLRSNLNKILGTYKDNTRFTGVINEVEDFYHQLDKYEYLLGICYKTIK